MKAVVDHLELRQNNFTKWLFLALTGISLFAFLIWNKERNGKWIALGGVLFFGTGYWKSLKYRLVTYQDGFTEQNVFKAHHVLWQKITSIKCETAYHFHGVSLELAILYGSPQKIVVLQVKQHNEKKMQRFFEMFNEQCPNAEKNEHFIKKSTGVMGWKDKLKMY